MMTASASTEDQNDWKNIGKISLVDKEQAGRNSTRELENPDLLVTIVDAQILDDVFTFTVQTKNSLPEYLKPEYVVNRQHKDFIWLNDQLQENKDYEAIMLPDVPMTMTLETSRETKDILERLSDTEDDVSQEDFNVISKNIEEEYLQIFKKTVADHQLYLRRLAAHPTLRYDVNFKCFVEYEQNLDVKPHATKDQAKKILRNLSRTIDDVLVSSGQPEEQEGNFNKEKAFLLNIHPALRDAQDKAANMVRVHREVAESYVTLCRGFENLRDWEYEQTDDPNHQAESSSYISNQFLPRKPTALDEFIEYMQKVKRCERVCSSDMDLKLVETLRYYNGEATAAKQMLYQRMRALQAQVTSAHNLERARNRNRGITEAESSWKSSNNKVNTISESTSNEVSDFQARRAEVLKMRLIDLAELQLKHAKTNHGLIQGCLRTIRDI